ncbi:flavin reductase family protein [Humisphaera borealis]|uniref:Flavin reductase family protein n=1 Tax=Humisphaera borealis TaxID=2807512 RepID=A0A7M2WQ44_9BACT|nr:flavin reductase family protein [Humisphaera borealis]QOV87598.1 flavin reductase family protein [Humisphaera borealis]
MDLDPASLTSSQRYKLLTCLVVPRPIALVTTLSDAGVVNAAPFSFFNVVGSEPPIVVLGIGDRADGTPKDTALNIRRTREFVVNVVTEATAAGMNVCATDFPPGQSELPAAGFTAEPSVKVRPPRIAESPVHLECREVQTIEIGENRIVMGEVVHIQIRDELIDRDKMYVRTEAIQAIGRMHAPSWYCRTNDLFELKRK